MVDDFSDFYGLSINLNDVITDVLWGLCFRTDRPVKLKAGEKVPILTDDAYEIVAEEWDKATALLKDEVVMAILDKYYRGIIDAGENKGELKEHFGWDYPDWEAPIAKEEYLGRGEITSRPAYNDESFELI